MRNGGSGLGNNSGRLKKIRKEDAANTPKIPAMFARHTKRKRNAEEEAEGTVPVPPAAAANGTATDAGDSEIGALTTQLTDALVLAVRREVAPAVACRRGDRDCSGHGLLPPRGRGSEGDHAQDGGKVDGNAGGAGAAAQESSQGSEGPATGKAHALVRALVRPHH